MMIIYATGYRTILLIPFIGYYTEALLRSPLKQIAFTRALQSSVTEAIALNVFDQNSLIKEFTCGCNDTHKIALYLAGFVMFGYISLCNDKENVRRLDFYRKSKRIIRLFILFLLVLFNKDVENAF